MVVYAARHEVPFSSAALAAEGGGRMVASDSDFGLVVIEPLSPAEATELFEAAAPAFKEPYVGGKLISAFRRAGFADVRIDVTASPDPVGHMRGVIENMLGHGTRFGRMSEARAVELRSRIDEALVEGSYLAVLPQWWARGTRDG